MQINLIKVFQDSWNFIRNKQQPMLLFMGMFVFSGLCFEFFIVPNFINKPSVTGQVSVIFGVQATSTPFVFAYEMILLILSCWCLSTIHQISRGYALNLKHSFVITLQRIWGVFLINILLRIPFALITTYALFSVVNLQLFILTTLAIVIAGMYLYSRFFLAEIHYLLTQQSLVQSLKTLWLSSKGRVVELFLCYLLIHFLPSIFIIKMSYASHSWFTDLSISVLISSVKVFGLVFTYRFYSLFMQKGQ